VLREAGCTTCVLEIAAIGLLLGANVLEGKRRALAVWLLLTAHDTLERHVTHFSAQNRVVHVCKHIVSLIILSPLSTPTIQAL
jgi:hypothetical protein